MSQLINKLKLLDGYNQARPNLIAWRHIELQYTKQKSSLMALLMASLLSLAPARTSTAKLPEFTMEQWNKLGIMNYQASNFHEAKYNFEAALKINPNSEIIELNLAQTLFALSELSAARKILLKLSASKDFVITANQELRKTLVYQKLRRQYAL